MHYFKQFMPWSMCHIDSFKANFQSCLLLNLNIKQLHITSNSPTSWTYSPKKLENIFNYTESEHCKIAPDGIGSIIKQSAGTLYSWCIGVFVTIVSESDITAIEKSLPQSSCWYIKVHQILWCKAKPLSINARSFL